MKGRHFTIIFGFASVIFFFINNLMGIFSVLLCILDINLQNTSLILTKLDAIKNKK